MPTVGTRRWKLTHRKPTPLCLGISSRDLARDFFSKPSPVTSARCHKPLIGCCFHPSAPRCLLFCLCSLYTINPLIRNQKPGCPWTESPPSLAFFNLKHHYPHPQTTLSGPLETGTGLHVSTPHVLFHLNAWPL